MDEKCGGYSVYSVAKGIMRQKKMENVTRRILLVVAYDGTNYHGWQAQDNADTIEGELNKALSSLLKTEVEVIGASRTDAGVHGMCNLAVFDTTMNIPPEKYAYALNQMLPADIVIRQSKEVEADFHPRKRKISKTYRYAIHSEEFPNPLKTRYSCFTYHKLDVDLMSQGSQYLLGEHDYTSFCSVNGTALTNVRTIDRINIISQGQDIFIDVTGNGFLYNMVRIIAGTLMEVGKGKISPEQIKDILEAKDRTKAGPTAPACGLTLVDIEY